MTHQELEYMFNRIEDNDKKLFSIYFESFGAEFYDLESLKKANLIAQLSGI